MRLQYRIFVATTGLDERLEIGVDALRRSSGLSDAIGLQVEAPGSGTPPSLYAGETFRPIRTGLFLGFLICLVSVSRTRLCPTSFVVVVSGVHMMFNRISYSARGHDRHESHPLLLILAQRLVERLPRVGDLLEVGRTSAQ